MAPRFVFGAQYVNAVRSTYSVPKQVNILQSDSRRLGKAGAGPQKQCFMIMSKCL